MKKSWLALTLLVGGCQQKPPAPDEVMATDEVELVTQGRNYDCGVAQVLAVDTARVRRIVGYSAYPPIYLALKLDTALWVRGSHTVLARIRQPQSGEYVFCHAMGPGYSPFVVTSARLKPGTR